jgi:hypothetical protein
MNVAMNDGAMVYQMSDKPACLRAEVLLILHLMSIKIFLFVTPKIPCLIQNNLC